MGRKKKIRIEMPQPEEGDYMVELPDGEMKCFSSKDAYSEAMAYAGTLQYAEVYRYVGWELVRTIDVEWERKLKEERRLAEEKNRAEKK